MQKVQATLTRDRHKKEHFLYSKRLLDRDIFVSLRDYTESPDSQNFPKRLNSRLSVIETTQISHKRS